MDGLLKLLLAFIAALDAATGAPVDANKMPDRPPITIPTLAPLPTLPLNSAVLSNETAGRKAISGTITNLQEGFVFVDGIPVLIGPATQINGQVRVGLNVQVQAILRADGVLEANELDLSENADVPPATTRPVLQTNKSSTDESLATPTISQEARPASPSIKPTEDIKPLPTEKPEVKAVENPTPEATVRTQVEPTENPAPQPTERIQVEPTDKPQAQPTSKPNEDGSKTVTSGGTSQPDNRNGDSGAGSDSGKEGSEIQPKGD